MRNNVSFEFYFNVFCGGNSGVIPAEQFPRVALLARREVDILLCQDCLYAENEECINLCICEVAEALFKAEKADGIKSESVDGYSVTFEDVADVRTDINRIVRRWLSNSGLLYAGVE